MIYRLFHRILTPICILIFIHSVNCFSQSRDSRNAIYAEAFGAGVLYSVNYEHFISNEFTIRVGFSLLNLNSNSGRDRSTITIVPIMVNYLLGAGNSKFEIGAGIDYLTASGESSGDISQVKTNSSSSGVVLIGSLGYRYQPTDGGLHFRIFATPFLSPYTGLFKLWFGGSIGFCF